MTFDEFLNGAFVGQTHVINQLEVLGNEVINGNNLNIILAARSGHGKTILGNAFVKWVEPKYYEKSFNYVGEVLKIHADRRFHVLDEAHLIEKPEILYPLMDSGHYVFIVLTNEYYELKEPFYNRCHEFNFAEYSEKELMEISNMAFIEKGINLPSKYLEFIVKNMGRGVPRSLKKISKRIAFYLLQNHVPNTFSVFVEKIENFLNVRDGLTLLDVQYLNFLSSARNNRASLSLIINATNIEKKLILEEIEPYLVSKGKIQITGRGRQLTGELKTL